MFDLCLKLVHKEGLLSGLNGASSLVTSLVTLPRHVHDDPNLLVTLVSPLSHACMYVLPC